MPNTVWDVTRLSSQPGNQENYSVIVYSIHVERRSAFYVANVILPSIVINYLATFNFLLPCESEDKVSYTVTIFLAQTVNMMSISGFMPQGGSSVPVLGQYLLASLFFIVTCLLATIRLVMLTTTGRNNSRSRQLHFVFLNLTPIFGPHKSVAKVHKAAEKDATGSPVNVNSRRADSEAVGASADAEEAEGTAIACETVNRICGVTSFTALSVLTVCFVIKLVLRF